MTGRQRCGLGLIITSFIIWACILLLPFTELAGAEQVMWGGVIYGISYGVFFLGIVLLGKEMWAKIKAGTRRIFRRGSKQNPPQS